MSLINSTYFAKPDIKLPIDNINVQDYIDKFESDFLTTLLGYELQKEFVSEIEGGTLAPKWVDLKNGAEYTYNNKLNYFSGVAEIESYYIKAMILIDVQGFISDAGAKFGMNENANNMNPRYLFALALNKVADLQLHLIDFINSKNLEIPGTYNNFYYTIFKPVNIFNV